MSSDSPLKPPHGRARLIEAAIRLFGRDGYDTPSLRALAAEAGVSWGLIRFYFGTKEGLRDAAEQQAVGRYLDYIVSGSQAAENVEELFQIIEEKMSSLPEEARFLRRAFVEERSIVRNFLRQLLELQESDSLSTELKERYPEDAWIIDPMADIASRLGYMLLAPQFISLLGRDVFSADELKKRNARQIRINELIRRGLEAERKETKPS